MRAHTLETNLAISLMMKSRIPCPRNKSDIAHTSQTTKLYIPPLILKCQGGNELKSNSLSCCVEGGVFRLSGPHTKLRSNGFKFNLKQYANAVFHFKRQSLLTTTWYHKRESSDYLNTRFGRANGGGSCRTTGRSSMN